MTPRRNIIDLCQREQQWVIATKRIMRVATIAAAALMQSVALIVPTEAQHRLGGPLVDGSVIRTRGCGSHFFIAYRDEFALAEWLGGEMVRENDVLQANGDQESFEHEGRVTLTNLVTGRTIDLVIEKALMNHADYSKTVGKICR
jgi:hypothetical protein